MLRRFQQLKILLWKNWTLQKRKPCVTVFEILIPIACFGILLGVFTLYSHKPYYRQGKVDGCIHISYRHDQVDILYAPSNPATNKILGKTLKNIRPIQHFTKNSSVIQAKPFTNEEELVSYYQNVNYSRSQILAGLVFSGSFSDDETVPLQVTVKIRSPRYNTRTTYDKTRPYCQPPMYDVFNKLLPLQYAVMTSIIELHKPGLNITRNTNITLQTMPCRKVYYSYFVEEIFEIVVPLFIMFSFILSALQLTKSVVLEK